MSRPCRCRRIRCNPDTNYFKPRGIPLDMLEEVNLALDELEAVRLADWEGLYQEDAAKKMNISRQTFGNIIERAHKIKRVAMSCQTVNLANPRPLGFVDL